MNVVHVLISIFIAQAAGIVGSVFTASNVQTWYVDLAKPAWVPPSWMFGPVWIMLYALMGIAAYLVWRKRAAQGARFALAAYGAHLVLNALWPILFFGLKNPGLAFAEIVVLFVSMVVLAVWFWKVNIWAGVLLLPSIGWVSFAAFLNYAIWQLQ
jgi:translocator protein